MFHLWSGYIYKFQVYTWTPSRAKDIFAAKSYYSNINLLKKICYLLIHQQNSLKALLLSVVKSIQLMVEMPYIEKLKNYHISFSFTTSGLVIYPNFPYLGARPDGIINCDFCGKSCLEIKCP